MGAARAHRTEIVLEDSRSITPAVHVLSLGKSTYSNRIAGVLWIVGAVAIASVLFPQHWPHTTLVTFLVAIGSALVMATVHLALRKRGKTRSLHIDVALANILVTAVTAVGASQQSRLANLYLLVALFAILYLPTQSAVIHVASAGLAYAVVLGTSDVTTELPLVAWLSVFGTATVLGVVIFELMRMLRITARQDPLTGIANRRSWDERLEEEIERSRRSGNPLSVVMVDLNNFKVVNDTAGHDAGDKLLCDLTVAWQGVVRGGGDFLARIGGDEFALLAPGSDAQGVNRLADRLSHALPNGVSVSIGTATWDGNEKSSDLVLRADRLMYEKKRQTV